MKYEAALFRLMSLTEFAIVVSNCCQLTRQFDRWSNLNLLFHILAVDTNHQVIINTPDTDLKGNK
jgi:hypothetical protein